MVERGRGCASCAARLTFVVNDDVEAALGLGADGFTSAAATREWSGRSRRGCCSALGVERRGGAGGRGAGAAYVGAGPVWATPSKTDADAPIGLDGLHAICAAVRVPVVAIGGVDLSNARRLHPRRRGGVAVIRAAATRAPLSEAIDAAR